LIKGQAFPHNARHWAGQPRALCASRSKIFGVRGISRVIYGITRRPLRAIKWVTNRDGTCARMAQSGAVFLGLDYWRNGKRESVYPALHFRDRILLSWEIKLFLDARRAIVRHWQTVGKAPHQVDQKGEHK
jgi:hypothetical protein